MTVTISSLLIKTSYSKKTIALVFDRTENKSFYSRVKSLGFRRNRTVTNRMQNRGHRHKNLVLYELSAKKILERQEKVKNRFNIYKGKSILTGRFVIVGTKIIAFAKDMER